MPKMSEQRHLMLLELVHREEIRKQQIQLAKAAHSISITKNMNRISILKTSIAHLSEFAIPKIQSDINQMKIEQEQKLAALDQMFQVSDDDEETDDITEKIQTMSVALEDFRKFNSEKGLKKRFEYLQSTIPSTDQAQTLASTTLTNQEAELIEVQKTEDGNFKEYDETLPSIEKGTVLYVNQNKMKQECVNILQETLAVYAEEEKYLDPIECEAMLMDLESDNSEEAADEKEPNP